MEATNKSAVDESIDIHSSAIVAPTARLSRGVRVGPFSVIGPDVVLGDNCVLHNNVTITGHTVVGRNCEFFPGCVIGTRPQDLKYRGANTGIEIGNNNVFREQVTAHPGTEGGGGVTRIGHGNLFMVGMHIGHDVTIGNQCIFANLCLLAGHVVLEDHVTVGGHVGIHHFATVGKHAMVAGMTKISSDVPPFMTVAATRSTRQEIRMVNGVGLKRSGFTEEQIRNLKAAFMRLFSRRARASGVPIIRNIQELRAEIEDKNVHYLCDFLLRSFECGRKGRYLESLRSSAPVEKRRDQTL